MICTPAYARYPFTAGPMSELVGAEKDVMILHVHVCSHVYACISHVTCM